MKTRINLYVPVLQPVREQLPLSKSLAVTASVFALAVFVCIGLYWLVDKESQQQKVLNAQLSIEQGRLASQAAKLSKINDNKQLLDKIELVRNQVKNKKRVLAALDNQTINHGGFTQLLLALAQVSDQKVWLTEIRSQQGSLMLSGSAKSSQAIPKWVSRLNQVEQLKGETFTSLTMHRNDAVINFVLNNQPLTTK